MQKSTVAIIGAGPAGSACAWKLSQYNIHFILLDKARFPRPKPCAGWITPLVLRDLDLHPSVYPYSITHFNNFQVYFKDFHFTLRTDQYAIRRIEFDNWLLERVLNNFRQHEAREISHLGREYIIDNEYAATHLVGAGGTHCPVKRAFFKHTGTSGNDKLIVAMEEEFTYPVNDDRCHLWFLQNGLPGYAWYVPKANGVVNIGIGGSAGTLSKNNDNLRRHWNLFIEKLDQLNLIRGHQFTPTGHSYYLRGKKPQLRQENAFLIGDALGLATLDMGEGIGPAIRSGIRAAEAIYKGKAYSLDGISRYSFPSLLRL